MRPANMIENTGVFYSSWSANSLDAGNGSTDAVIDLVFDNSRSNPTYINGGTIRPKSLSVLVLLRL